MEDPLVTMAARVHVSMCVQSCVLLKTGIQTGLLWFCSKI